MRLQPTSPSSRWYKHTVATRKSCESGEIERARWRISSARLSVSRLLTENKYYGGSFLDFERLYSIWKYKYWRVYSFKAKNFERYTRFGNINIGVFIVSRRRISFIQSSLLEERRCLSRSYFVQAAFITRK